MDKCDAISVIKLMNHIILNCTHSWEDQKKQKENQTGPKSSSSAVSPPMEGRDERKIQFDFNKQGQKNAWQQIVLTVNAAFPRTRRSPKDCEKRWYNELATTRKEIAAYKESMRATATGTF